jgi:multidrug efflux pump
VNAALPQLTASLPADITVTPVLDRTTTIRASLKDTERTLLIAIGLVVMVVFLFLRNWRATLIPASRCRCRSSARSARCTCSASRSTTCR